MSKHGFQLCERPEAEFDEFLCYFEEGGIKFFNEVLTRSRETFDPKVPNLTLLKHFQKDLRETWIQKERHAKKMAPPDLEEILRRIDTIDVVKKYWIEANAIPHPFTQKTEEWRIEIKPESSFVPGSPAYCNLYERAIYLSSKLSQTQALAWVIFELTNAVSSLKNRKLHQRHFSWQISTNAYTRLTEKIEFEGAGEHHKIIQAAADAGQLTPIDKDIMDLYKNITWGWPVDWEQQKKTVHAEYYRMVGRRMQEKSMSSTRHEVIKIMKGKEKGKEVGFSQRALDSFNGPELQAFEDMLMVKGEKRLRAYLQENRKWLNQYRDSESPTGVIASVCLAEKLPAQPLCLISEYADSPED